MSRLSRRILAAAMAVPMLPALGQPATALRFEVLGTPAQAEDVAQVVRARLRSLGIDGAEVQVAAEELRVLLPLHADAAGLARLLVRPGRLSMHAVTGPSTDVPRRALSVPDTGNPGRRFPLSILPVLEGDIVASAIASTDAGTGTRRIDVKLRPEAAGQLHRITTDLRGQMIAILLDGDILLVPRVMEPIRDGSFVISSRMALPEARQIAALLAAGPLPHPLRALPAVQ